MNFPWLPVALKVRGFHSFGLRLAEDPIISEDLLEEAGGHFVGLTPVDNDCGVFCHMLCFGVRLKKVRGAVLNILLVPRSWAKDLSCTPVVEQIKRLTWLWLKKRYSNGLPWEVDTCTETCGFSLSDRFILIATPTWSTNSWSGSSLLLAPSIRFAPLGVPGNPRAPENKNREKSGPARPSPEPQRQPSGTLLPESRTPSNPPEYVFSPIDGEEFPQKHTGILPG